jgi:hypothetical protein
VNRQDSEHGLRPKLKARTDKFRRFFGPEWEKLPAIRRLWDLDSPGLLKSSAGALKEPLPKMYA